jgi:hypothetical protein
VALPAGAVLIAQEICNRCGEGSGLTRVWRDGAGDLRRERLFSPPAGETVFAVAAAQDGSDLVVVTVGVSGHTSVFRSSDGGTTFAKLGTASLGLAVERVGETFVLLRPDRSDGTRYLLFPSGVAVDPAEVAVLEAASAAVVRGTFPTAAYRTGSADTTRTFRLPEGGYVVTREAPSGAGESVGVLGLLDGGGHLRRAFAGEFGSLVGLAEPGMALVGSWLVGVPYAGQPLDAFRVPALVDLSSGTVHPIAELLFTDLDHKAWIPVALQQAPGGR